LDLTKIKYEIETTKIKGGEVKKVSPEDIWQLKSI